MNMQAVQKSRYLSHVCVYCLQANKWYPTTVDPIWMDRQRDCLDPTSGAHVFSLLFSSYWHDVPNDKAGRTTLIVRVCFI